MELFTSPCGCVDPVQGARLAAYEWGLLSGQEAEAFERHVMSCEACARDLATSPLTGLLRPRRRWVRAAVPVAVAAMALLALVATLHRSPSPQVASAEGSVTFEWQVPAEVAQFTFELNVPPGP